MRIFLTTAITLVFLCIIACKESKKKYELKLNENEQKGVLMKILRSDSWSHINTEFKNLNITEKVSSFASQEKVLKKDVEEKKIILEFYKEKKEKNYFLLYELIPNYLRPSKRAFGGIFISHQNDTLVQLIPLIETSLGGMEVVEEALSAITEMMEKDTITYDNYKYVRQPPVQE